MENSKPSEILDKIKSSKNILINMDTRTDYDALASSIFISKYIEEKLGIKTTIIHANKIGDRFNRFFPYDQIKTSTDIATVDLNQYDLIIFLDSGALHHISLNNECKIPEDIATINIDHHESNERFGKLNYVYKCGSCCSVLYLLFKELNIELPLEYLNILGVGIVTDTGSFRHDSCDASDFRIAAELVEKGVQIWLINSKLIADESIDQIRFKEIVYRNLKVNTDKRYAYTTISTEELEQASINMEKVYVRHSDLINYVQNTDLVFAVAEVNTTPKYIEVSFRSRKLEIDASEVASRLGGGGHPGAAGAKLYDCKSISEAVDRVLSILN